MIHTQVAPNKENSQPDVICKKQHKIPEENIEPNPAALKEQYIMLTQEYSLGL